MIASAGMARSVCVCLCVGCTLMGMRLELLTQGPYGLLGWPFVVTVCFGWRMRLAFALLAVRAFWLV